MTPGARTQAAIEIVDAVIAAAREGGAAADTIVQRYFAARRYAGSKDRRAVRELAFAAIRRAGEVPASGRAAVAALADEDAALAATFGSGGHGPAPLTSDEPRAAPGLAPAWLEARLAASQVPTTDLVGRAPLDLRANLLKGDRDFAAAALPGAEPTPHSPWGLRLPAGTRVDDHPAVVTGLVEVQDEGSQLVSLAAAAAPGMTLVDLCAGGGGKTLALAAAMENRGRILACDVDRRRLGALAPRAERAGVTIAETLLLDPRREAEQLTDVACVADLVMVDAPCSGTGTWRRNPEARWRLTPARLARLIETQAHVLDVAAPLVRPGGAIAYVVCSLLDEEGASQVDAFLSRHPGWTAVAPNLPAGEERSTGVRLAPATSGTDGFFVARLTAPC